MSHLALSKKRLRLQVCELKPESGGRLERARLQLDLALQGEHEVV